ncbi:hypothetical protein DRP04_03950 [Archaeoglobales archaeon]|nr:MAG: hypothetical protein DRP04_03950 [Archaeoglobales archaeon]
MKEAIISFGEPPIAFSFCLKWENSQLIRIMDSTYVECKNRTYEVASMREWKKKKLAEVDRDLAFLFSVLTYGYFYQDLFPKRVFIFYRDGLDVEELWKVVVSSLFFEYIYKRGRFGDEDLSFLVKLVSTSGSVYFSATTTIYTKGTLLYSEDEKEKGFLQKMLDIIGARRVSRTKTSGSGHFLLRINETYQVTDKDCALRLIKMFLMLNCMHHVLFEFDIEDLIRLFSLFFEDKSFLNYVELIIKMIGKREVLRSLENIVELIQKTPANKRVKAFLALMAVM